MTFPLGYIAVGRKHTLRALMFGLRTAFMERWDPRRAVEAIRAGG